MKEFYFPLLLLACYIAYRLSDNMAVDTSHFHQRAVQIYYSKEDLYTGLHCAVAKTLATSTELS